MGNLFRFRGFTVLYFCFLCVYLAACKMPDYEEDKFKLLNETTEKIMPIYHEEIVQRLDRFKRLLKAHDYPYEVVEIYHTAEKLMRITAKLISEIEDIKRRLHLKTPREAEELMLGKNKDGLAYQLKAKLDNYVDVLYETSKKLELRVTYPKTESDYNVTFPLLMGDNRNYPFYKHTHFENLDFAQTHFKNTSTEVMIFILTQKQLEVQEYFREVLRLKDIGSMCYYHEKIPRSMPASWQYTHSNKSENNLT